MRRMCIVALILMSFAVIANAQQTGPVIRNFPLGVGRSVNQTFWDYNRSILKGIADSLQDSTKRVEVYPWIDAKEYLNANLTDELNGGLVNSRYMAVTAQLMKLGVRSWQILPPSPRRDSLIGGEYRRVEFRIISAVVAPVVVKQVEQRPATEHAGCKAPAPITNVENNYYILGRLGIGVAYVPTNAFIPIVHGELGTPRLRLMVDAGLTPWELSEEFGGIKYTTRHTYISVFGAWQIADSSRWSIIGGWYRNELRNLAPDRHFERCEGIDLGFRCAWETIGVTASWSPGVYDPYGKGLAPWHADQFRISADITLLQGGKK